MNYRRNSTNLLIGIIVVAVVIFIGLTWANLKFAEQNPGGNDFLVHWMGTRKFLKEGISPYSDETAVAIQTMAYGRPAQEGEHELRVAYPFYSIFIFLPFALIEDFTVARAIWMTVLEISIILLSYISIRMTKWKPGLSALFLFMVFSVLWYHSVRPLINGNAVILVALGIAGGLWAIKNNADELAGVLFAFTTIKPNLVLLIIVFILIWMVSQRRWKFPIWFMGTLVILVLGAQLLMPDWIFQNLREILRYPSYNPPGTLATALKALLPGLGDRIKWPIAGILGLVLFLEWMISRQKDFWGFLWTACLTLVISEWIGIQTDPGNFIIAFPAIVLVFTLWERRWPHGGKLFSLTSMAILFIGIWWLFLKTVIPGDQPQQSPIMFIPLPLFLLISLYWVRWWAQEPPSLLYDDDLSKVNFSNKRY